MKADCICVCFLTCVFPNLRLFFRYTIVIMQANVGWWSVQVPQELFDFIHKPTVIALDLLIWCGLCQLIKGVIYYGKPIFVSLSLFMGVLQKVSNCLKLINGIVCLLELQQSCYLFKQDNNSLYFNLMGSFLCPS